MVPPRSGKGEMTFLLQDSGTNDVVIFAVNATYPQALLRSRRDDFLRH